MSELPSEMYQVHAMLKRYVAIHDRVFRFSLRKLIPIPGIFDPVDFDQHFRELDAFVLSLEQLAVSTSGKAGVPSVFQQYVTALLKTMQFLRDMCRRLYDKSQGDRSYTMVQYKADMTTYEGLVERYRSLGSTLNESVRKLEHV